MTIQIGVYRIITYPACSVDDILRMGVKPDYSYDNFFYLRITHLITELKLHSQVIGYNSGSDPVLCYLGDALHGLQVIVDNRVYHFSFSDEEENFVIELLTSVIAVFPITSSFFVIHEIGVRKVSFMGHKIWEITTEDTIKNFRIDIGKKCLILELYNSRCVVVHLNTGYSTIVPPRHVALS